VHDQTDAGAIPFRAVSASRAVGFLVQWPTLLTLAMFPVLVWMYVRLAHQEEQEVRAEFGEAYDRYAARTPRWLPGLGGAGTASSSQA